MLDGYVSTDDASATLAVSHLIDLAAQCNIKIGEEL